MITSFRTEYDRYKGIDRDGYIVNEYFTYSLKEGNTLITTRYRAWVVLDDEEYELLQEHRVEENPELYSLLEDLGIILTQRNLNDITKIHAERYFYVNQPPSLFIMVPTNRCNQRCTYCHAKVELATEMNSKWDMTENIAYKTVDFFYSVPKISDDFHIEFQGGEALLRYRFIQKIMDYAMAEGEKVGRDVSFTMISNLTLMKDWIAEDIKTRGNIRLGSSLDGPAEINDKQRFDVAGRGTYDSVVYWVKRLRDKYGIPVGLMPTVTVNHVGAAKSLVDEYIELGLKNVAIRQLNNVNPLEKTWKERISVDEHTDLWTESLQYIFEKNRDGVEVREMETTHFLHNMMTVSGNYMCDRRPCGAAMSQITVDQTGDVFVCDLARSLDEFCMGNVLTHTYDEIITSQVAQAVRGVSSETMPKCNSCAFNAYCGHCQVRSFYQHGSPLPEGPDDFECERNLKMIPYLFKKLIDESDPDKEILESWVD